MSVKEKVRGVLLKGVRLFQEPPESINPFVMLNHEIERRLVKKLADDNALWYRDAIQVRKAGLDARSIKGQTLEFGVWVGNSIRFIAEHTSGEIHGFDSFEGFPPDDPSWADTKFGHERLSLNGKLPEVPSNVTLHKGWFKDTLAPFVAEHREPISYMHVDCDIYMSTKCVFDNFAPMIQAGTIIQFDEYGIYPGWQFEEHLAFMEFVRRHKVQYTMIAVGGKKIGYPAWMKLAVRIDAIKHAS